MKDFILQNLVARVRPKVKEVCARISIYMNKMNIKHRKAALTAVMVLFAAFLAMQAYLSYSAVKAAHFKDESGIIADTHRDYSAALYSLYSSIDSLKMFVAGKEAEIYKLDSLFAVANSGSSDAGKNETVEMP